MIPIKYIAVSIAMLLAAALGKVLEPTQLLVDKASEVKLESVIPEKFGGWTEVTQLDQINANQVGTTVPGDELSRKIYDQTVMRTYRDSQGNTVMLAAAYGTRQNDELKVHRPEVCYSAQGFQILQQTQEEMSLGNTVLPVTRLVARNGQRIEPITYWVRVGDEIVRGGLYLKIAIIKAGLTGTIPDGLLIRVSTIIDSDSPAAYNQAYDVQNKFLKDLLASSDTKTRKFLIGNMNGN